MTNPTNHSTRLIAEGAVVALVQGKIDAAESKIERLDGTDLKLAATLLDQIVALRTVISGLRYIHTPEVIADTITVLEGFVHPGCRHDDDIIARLTKGQGKAVTTPAPVDEYADDPLPPPQRYVVRQDLCSWEVYDTVECFILTRFVIEQGAQSYANHLNAKA